MGGSAVASMLLGQPAACSFMQGEKSAAQTLVRASPYDR